MSTQAVSTPASSPPASYPGMVTCGACGNTLHVTAPICPHCGASQRSRGYKSKVAAGLLAIFLGAFGVHRFYLGQWWGIFYLLLFWTLIPGLIALIEGIVFLVTNDDSWNDKHNEGKPKVGGEGSAGLVIALVAGVFVAVMVLGILAAIAIPAYQDYTIRAKVMASVAAATEVRDAVEQFVSDERAYPGSSADIGMAEQAASDGVHVLTVQEGGVIVMTFTGKIRTLEAKTLIFTPRIEDDTLYWDCRGGTLRARFRPTECR